MYVCECTCTCMCVCVYAVCVGGEGSRDNLRWSMKSVQCQI